MAEETKTNQPHHHEVVPLNDTVASASYRSLQEARSWGGENDTAIRTNDIGSLHQQSSGEDTGSGNGLVSPTIGSGRPPTNLASSWSGTSTLTSRPPLPPPPPPSQLPDRAAYHAKNQQFLQQVASGGLKHTRSAPSASASHFASPSPNTMFRKRLQLKSIEEDDGQSFVKVDRHSHSNKNSDHGSVIYHQKSTHTTNNDNNVDDWTTTSIHVRNDNTENDDVSVMSSLAGSLAGYSQRRWSATDNSIQSERLLQFEREQKAQFQQTKYDMEQRLTTALHAQSSPAQDEATNELVKSYLQELERERNAMMAQWKAEMLMEEERIRQSESRRRLVYDCYEAIFKPCVDSIWSLLATTEVVLSNMPITIGAVGLSWVTMGVVWYKFTEEMVDACQHVNYFSNQCSFREFPGCFECDINDPNYQAALGFHYLCSGVAGICCVLFLLKVILAPNVVLDMLQNPTTSTPAGVWCICMVCTFAGHEGIMGEIIVLITATLHLTLALWFLWRAVYTYRAWVDPGWFPNIVGISYAAVKTWIYFPGPGLFLMTLCTIFFLSTFFVSVVRVALNHKIAAPVCWIQLSAPSITLYCLTLLSQPTRHEESLLEISNTEKQHFHDMLVRYYLPLQHFFMFLTMIGLFSAVQSLWVRWPMFKTKPFSPAHVAFCFPTLSHTNSVQAYRASLNAYSSISPDSVFKQALFGYWCFFLVSGTILNLVFTYKYIVRIPEWTKPDISGEEEPPAPDHTIVHEMLDETGAHETIKQPFISPAVLEANEAGVLVRVKRGTEDYRIHGPFVRTRKISSLGFDLVLSEMELREERARLLDWVAKNAPKKRNRTLSLPGVFHLRGNDGRDVYGTFSDLSQAETLVRCHARSKTVGGAVV